MSEVIVRLLAVADEALAMEDSDAEHEALFFIREHLRALLAQQGGSNASH